MTQLSQLLARLHRDLNSALAESRATPGPVQLLPDRVTLSLEVLVDDDGIRLAAAPSASSVPGHRLTLEFHVLVPETTAAAQPIPEPPATGSPARFSDAPSLVESLAQIFGPPGFDSSARATVFREALANSSEQQLRGLLESFEDASAAPLDEPSKRTRHLLSRVLASGPAGSASRGGEILAALLQHHSLPSILALVATAWKTQDQWLNS